MPQFDPRTAATLARLALFRQHFPLFAEHVLRIQTKADGLQPFVLLPFQRRLYKRLRAQEHRRGWIRQVWLKSRQIGYSTLSLGLAFHRTALFPNRNAVLVAHEVGAAEMLFNMTRRFYHHLPEDLRPAVRYSTRTELVFNTASEKSRTAKAGLDSKIVIATARNVHSGAGGTFQTAVLSEASRYENPAEIESSTLQAIGFVPGSSVIIESTAWPTGQWFFDMCEAAQHGDTPYEFQFTGWNEDPTCWVALEEGEDLDPTPDEAALMREFTLTPEQIKWRRLKLAELRGDTAVFLRDYPLTPEEAWTRADLAVFPYEHLQLLKAKLGPPLYRAEILGGGLFHTADGPLSVWEEPQTDALYDIGADVATAEGGDWSAAEVVERKSGRQVAEFRGHLSPGEFADALAVIGTKYHTAQIAVERNGIGAYTNERLVKSLSYPNVYLWRPPGRLEVVTTKSTGWLTTHRLKQMLIATAKDRVYRYVTGDERGQFALVRSTALVHELERYTCTGPDQYGAMPGAHDDLVTAWMIALKARHDEIGEAMPNDWPHVEPLPVVYNDPARYMTPEEARVGRPTSWWGDVEGWE